MDTATGRDPAPNPEAKRFRVFANYFKSYMSVSGIVAAALPIPITAWKVIPVYASMKGSLATYTPLLCFLVLSFVYFARHRIASAIFNGRGQAKLVVETFVLTLIGLVIFCIISYHRSLDESLKDPSLDLANTPAHRIQGSTGLMLLYMGIFVFAEAAFVLMALREYLQDLLKLSDEQIIMESRMRKPSASERMTSEIEELKTLLMRKHITESEFSERRAMIVDKWKVTKNEP